MVMTKKDGVYMRYVLGLLMAGLVAAIPAAGQVTITGGNGATLDQIAGTDTRVTIQLKAASAEVANLRITEMRESHFEAVNEKGVEAYYPYDAVTSITVQGGIVEVSARDVTSNQTLSEDENSALQEALTKIRQWFQNGQGIQAIKMEAATLLIVAGEDDEKEGARGYLDQLLNANDMPTRMAAAMALYEAGDPGPAQEVALEGLNNRDRSVRAAAAILAGLTRNQAVPNPDEDDKDDEEPNAEIEVRRNNGVVLQLNRMVRDRSAEVSAPAAWALGRIGDTAAVPTILSMLGDRSVPRSEAAMLALIELGGEDLIEGLQLELKRQEGLARFRVARVLHALGDEIGTNVIRNEYLESRAVPIRHRAAVILAVQGEVKALQVLREDLRSRYDPTPDVLLRRAEAVEALIQAGDRTYMGAFQELLGQSNQFESRNDAVLMQNQIGEAAVLAVIAKSGVRSLLPTVSPSVSNHQPLVSISACGAAVALAYDDYRQRISEIFTLITS
jgi:HEAT repeat protein